MVIRATDIQRWEGHSWLVKGRALDSNLRIYIEDGIFHTQSFPRGILPPVRNCQDQTCGPACTEHFNLSFHPYLNGKGNPESYLVALAGLNDQDYLAIQAQMQIRMFTTPRENLPLLFLPGMAFDETMRNVSPGRNLMVAYKGEGESKHVTVEMFGRIKEHLDLSNVQVLKRGRDLQTMKDLEYSR